MEVLANMLEAVVEFVLLVGPYLLTLEQLGQAFERFRAVLADSAKRRKDRSNITTGEDFDEDEAEALEVSLYHRMHTLYAEFECIKIESRDIVCISPCWFHMIEQKQN